MRALASPRSHTEGTRRDPLSPNHPRPLHSYSKHTMKFQEGPGSWDREQSSAASRRRSATSLDNFRCEPRSRSGAGGREAEKLQLSLLLLISDLLEVETFHGPPQITITSGALEGFKRGSSGLVVVDEAHRQTSKQQGGPTVQGQAHSLLGRLQGGRLGCSFSVRHTDPHWTCVCVCLCV